MIRLPAIVLGFALSFAIAFATGYFIEMALPGSHGTLAFYAVEFAGILIAMTVFYLTVRKSYRRHKRNSLRFSARFARSGGAASLG